MAPATLQGHRLWKLMMEEAHGDVQIAVAIQ